MKFVMRDPNIHITWDVPITMSDGTVPKANVYRPADATSRPIDTRTPVLVNMTPYTKLASDLVDHMGSVPGRSDIVSQLARDIDMTALRCPASPISPRRSAAERCVISPSNGSW